ncbi:MAG: hypothetical protein RLZZ546_1647, partial [Bacteroidota bacterium]
IVLLIFIPSLFPSAKAQNFKELSNEMNAMYKTGVKGYKQWKRKEWFLQQRLYPSSKIENLTTKTFREFENFKQRNASNRETHGSWAFQGPTFSNTGNGRLNTIAIHPTNENIIYVGSSNGGIWKSTSGGTSWVNVSPNIPLLAIADIKINPSNTNEIFVLTGDGDPSPSVGSFHGQMEISSIGIIKSIDGGNTWQPSNLSINTTNAMVPYKLLIDPNNFDIQFIAANGRLLRTANQWQTIDTVITNTTYDIEFKPGNSNIMYASGSNWIRRSTDNGENWDLITDADFSWMSSSSRVELAVAPNNVSVVYALAGGWNNGLDAFYLSTDSGQNNTWTLKNTTETVHGAFTTYCVGLAVDPNDWNDVYGGMQWICKSTNQGGNWTSIVQNTVHADIHDVLFYGSNLYVACDGGLYKSANQGSTWTNLSNGLAITEVYRIGGTPQNADLFFIGTQDNGTMKKSSSSTTFENSWGGDGMNCNINPLNTNIVYASQQNGVFGKSNNGGVNFNILSMPASGAWISPFEIDAVDTSILFAGLSSTVVRSNNGGSSWITLNNDPFTTNVNCLAQGTNSRNILYAASSDINNTRVLGRCNNALANSNISWTNITAGLPNLFITGLAVNPDDATEVYVTMSGYSDGEKVYKSNNSGTNWDNISDNLPNVPINCIVFHDTPSNIDAVYIGTDIGVFYRDNNIGQWIFFSNFLPVTIVNDLYINTANNTIAAGTYGRGLWKSPLYSACNANLNLTNYNGGVRYYSLSNSITANANIQTDLGHKLNLQAGSFINFTPGFNIGGQASLNAKIGICPTPYDNSTSPAHDGSFIDNEAFRRWLDNE